MMKKGVFITFEGADGCGKTTQINLLKKKLDEKNIKNIKTFEPGDTNLGKTLREMLLYTKEPVSDVAESFLYLADRAQHVEFEIKPALKDGQIVLCDRFIDSTICYQGYARGGDISTLERLNDIATEGLKPDLTIVFDIDSKIAQERLMGEKDRLEGEGLEFHKKLRFGYLELAEKNPQRIKVLDASKTIEEVHKSVLQLVLGLIK